MNDNFRSSWPASRACGNSCSLARQIHGAANKRYRDALAPGSQGIATTKQGQPAISPGPHLASSCSLRRSSIVLTRFRAHGSKTLTTFGAPCIKDVTPMRSTMQAIDRDVVPSPVGQRAKRVATALSSWSHLPVTLKARRRL